VGETDKKALDEKEKMKSHAIKEDKWMGKLGKRS